MAGITNTANNTIQNYDIDLAEETRLSKDQYLKWMAKNAEVIRNQYNWGRPLF